MAGSPESVDAPLAGDELRRELAAAQAELEEARAALRRERELRAEESAEHALDRAQTAAQAEELRREAWDWCVHAVRSEEERERLLSSRSWRLTAPLRWLTALRARLRGTPALTLPEVAEPRVTLVVPVHSQPELTRACLASIVANTPPIYEVVLVDDAADGPTKRMLRSAVGARTVVNEENLGFTRSVNRGAAESEAEFVVICNDDIEVQDGWLTALLDCADSAPDVGVVVPKFLLRDGRVAEAGGIVWSDGSARPFGRGRDIHFAPASYRREVDYGSAAAMLVRSDFWREVGGFDEAYSPAYYEDTDLCFAARDRGLRVMYEPAARVVHVEGASHGTDLNQGIKAYQRVNAPRFAEKWASALSEQPQPSEDWADIRRASNRATGPRVLVIDHRLPSPDIDSGSNRMMALLRSLIGLGCSVRFLPDDEFRWEPYSSDLQRLGVEVLYGYRAIRDELSAFGADLSLVLMSRPQTARLLPLVRELAPRARVAYDTVDLHFLRERRRAAFEQDASPVAAAYEALEAAMVRGADVTVCVSEEEASLVQAEVPGTSTAVISNAHEVVPEPAPLGSRSGLIFLGSYIHPPNPDAARFLAEEVMPRVRELAPEAEAAIAGSQMGEEIEALATDRLQVEGWIEDIDARLDRARVMLAPLRFGAGVKGKITLSLARGLPVVTTPVGAEGLGATHGEHILVAEDAEGLARETARLLDDDELWRSISRGGLELARRRFSAERVGETLAELLPR